MSEGARLLPGERQQRIRQLALEQSALRVNELAARFNVSEMTIRRDLGTLAGAGHLARTFGGAVAAEQSAFESSYLERLAAHTPAKGAIARYAAGLIQDGDTVAIDASTTGLALAKELGRRRLTVVTNGLDCAQELRASPAKVIVTGGYLRQVAGSFAGPFALSVLRDLRVDQAFISAKGVLVPDGLMDSDLDEVAVKRAMMEAAARVIALADSSKFGKPALGMVAPLAAFDLIVSDERLSEEEQSKLVQHQIPAHLVPL